MIRGMLMATSSVAALLALGACASDPTPPPSQTVAPQPDPSHFTPAPTGVPEAGDGGQDDNDDRTREPAIVPTSDRDRTTAASTATTVMSLFARRDVSADRWIKDLTPLLTPQAAEDYAYTDPANVPATKVTGPAKVVPTDSATLARIHIPTDAGTYLVVLTRDTDSAWRVARITPPETEVGD